MDDTEQAPDASPAPEADGWDWGIVEIMGHRTRAGRVREVEQFGSKMLRIDIPIKGDAAANGWMTEFYGGASIFSYRLTDEATVNRANKPFEPASRFSLPAPDRAALEDDDDPIF